MYLNKSMGAMEWNVMVCICLAQGVAVLGGVALLEWVCHCGHGLLDPHPSCPEASILLAAFIQMKMYNSQLLLYHACLDVAMFPL